eukprot:scaffold89757_cov31-Tisochrysis_lutea.AAC.3
MHASPCRYLSHRHPARAAADWFCPFRRLVLAMYGMGYDAGGLGEAFSLTVDACAQKGAPERTCGQTFRPCMSYAYSKQSMVRQSGTGCAWCAMLRRRKCRQHWWMKRRVASSQFVRRNGSGGGHYRMTVNMELRLVSALSHLRNRNVSMRGRGSPVRYGIYTRPVCSIKWAVCICRQRRDS